MTESLNGESPYNENHKMSRIYNSGPTVTEARVTLAFIITFQPTRISKAAKAGAVEWSEMINFNIDVTVGF